MINDDRLPQKNLVIEYLSRMPFYKWAAAFAKIDRTTLENWRKEDKEFSALCESAKAEAIDRLGRRATPDFMLKSADSQTFKERLDVTSGDKPIPIIPINVPGNNSDSKDKATE